MKKILVSAATLIIFSAVSQAQIKVGIKGGGNEFNQRINSTNGGSLYGGDKDRSFHAGFIGDLQIAGNFYLQPQLLWSRKGATHFHSTEEGATKVRINYIDIPVNVVYKMPLGFGSAFGGAGAAFSYAVNGKQEVDGHKSNLFKGTNSFRREDLSLSFTAGLELNNGLFVSINSEKGLLNVSKTAGVNIKNRTTSVSLGYMIDWKKLNRKKA
jgi:Outer membrane protein beta-barrel domain